MTPENDRAKLAKGLFDLVPEDHRVSADAAITFVTVTLEPAAAHLIVLATGVLMLGTAVWPEPSSGGVPKKGKKPKPVESAPGARAEKSSNRPSRKDAKKVAKAAKQVEADRGYEEAAEFLLDHGLHDEAVAIFEREDRLDRVAEVRYDQNRFDEAAQAYEASERWENAGSIYQHGEMYERAECFNEAGHCYRAIGFHRHAAQAFLKANADLEAAQSLVTAFEDEGAGAGKSDQAQRELQTMAKKAGELFYKHERFEDAERILVRAGAYASAAKVAFHTGAYERAAELFLRIGRGDLASKALEKLDDPTAAAKALGEYLRDKGDTEEAVTHLEKAGEFQEAGDLYRQLSNFEQAGECYVKVEDFAAAAEMFRATGQLEKAGNAYEQSAQYDEAARCMNELGESLREAQLLEKAGRHFDAGRGYAALEEVDEAIRVLQLINSEHENYGEVCALLGALFAKKGMHSLSVKKFEEATAGNPVSRDNISAYYHLAQSYEQQQDYASAVDVYEKVMAFDYHFEQVSERLQQAKQERSKQSKAKVTTTPSKTTQATTGRYQVVRQIGRGGMGVVYLARDSTLEREVAYKVLPEQLRENPNALKNFLREAKAAAQLNHPNIVTVYDAGESEHGFYLAMELVEGTTLKEIVQRRGSVSPAGVIYIVRQMAEALAYAHSKKVVHRDIKTANTMWTPERQVKIMDFGLARLMEEVRNATTVVSGTPFYMSPEQTLGKNIDHRTDIYSLGVTLFELSTGQLPFRRGNVPYHHVHTPPPEPRQVNPKIPEGLQAIILRCLAKSPEERYPSARELVEEVDALKDSAAG
jgi:tetratricopeptide (TPR) repeat protein